VEHHYKSIFWEQRQEGLEFVKVFDQGHIGEHVVTSREVLRSDEFRIYAIVAPLVLSVPLAFALGFTGFFFDTSLPVEQTPFLPLLLCLLSALGLAVLIGLPFAYFLSMSELSVKAACRDRGTEMSKTTGHPRTLEVVEAWRWPWFARTHKLTVAGVAARESTAPSTEIHKGTGFLAAWIARATWVHRRKSIPRVGVRRETYGNYANVTTTYQVSSVMAHAFTGADVLRSKVFWFASLGLPWLGLVPLGILVFGIHRGWETPLEDITRMMIVFDLVIAGLLAIPPSVLFAYLLAQESVAEQVVCRDRGLPQPKEGLHSIGYEVYGPWGWRRLAGKLGISPEL